MDYEQVISDTESKYNLKPGVLKQLIKVESGGWTGAKSPKGAVGLTQLLPSTAKELGVDPYDPVQNIEGGAKYLRQGLDKFNEDYGQAIAGYNAGHNNKAVINRDWNMLPKQTKDYTNQFLDFIIPTASASEKPYKAPKETTAESFKASDFTPVDQSPETFKASDFTPVDQTTDLPWSEVPERAVKNFPKSMSELGQGVINMVPKIPAYDPNKQLSDIHPMENVVNPIDVAKQVGSAIGDFTTSPIETTKHLIAEHPAQVIAFAQPVGKGISAATKAAPKIANEVANTVPVLKKIRDVSNTDVLNKSLHENTTELINQRQGTNAATLPEAVSAGKKVTTDVYNQLKNVQDSIPTQFNHTSALDAFNNVTSLHDTVLNGLTGNAKRAYEKIITGEPTTAAESVDLFQQLPKLKVTSPSPAPIKLALKDAQRAVGEDIANNGHPELTNALNTATMTKAATSGAKKISKIVTNSSKRGATNWPAVSEKLETFKNNEKNQTIFDYNPGLKEDITKIQTVINKHPEASKLVEKPREPNPLTSIASVVAGRTIPGRVARVAAYGIGGMPAVIGTDIALSGTSAITKGAAKLISKLPPVKNAYKAQLDTQLKPTGTRAQPVQYPPYVAPPPAGFTGPTQPRVPLSTQTNMRINLPPSGFTGPLTPSPPGFTGPPLMQTPPAGMNIPIPAGPSSYLPLGLPAPNPLRTVRPGNIDVIPTDIVNKVLRTSKVESVVKPGTPKVEMKPKVKRVKKEMKPKE